MKNKGKLNDAKKGKKHSGQPISAFVTYSKKRKNTDNAISLKKLKKKHGVLSEILAGNKIVKSLDNQNLSMSHLPVTVSKKKKKNKVVKKRQENLFSNGHSKFNESTKASKKLAKALKSKKKLVNDDLIATADDELFTSEGLENLDIPETGAASESQSINDEDKSLEKDDSSATCPDGVAIDLSEHEESVEDDSQEMIPKCLSNNPMDEAKGLFQWLIHPLPVEKFFEDNWETAPLHIKRSKMNYYRLLMSTPMLDTILRDFHILFTENIDITSYSNGQRETHNPPGRARPSVVWDYYSNGCSVRMLNPQTFIPRLHALNATLQEFFGCFVGANSYLTPPDSQGFAPHYDDIEAFILQIEGKKRWRLYKPKTEAEYLPRDSSKNFDPSEIGEPILDTIVNAGDLLYFPRGTVHQGETLDGTHSLHITLSVYQKNSWCDFIERLIPEAIKTAVQSDSRYREGLPIDYLRHVGYVHDKKDTDVRRNFIEKTKKLLHTLVDHIDVDKIADQMSKRDVHNFLPPVLSPEEQERSILQDGERMTTAGRIENRVEIEPDTRIRLLRSHCVRLVKEDDCTTIYYSTENSKTYHEYEPQFLEVEEEIAPAIQKIILSYPDFVRVDDLPIEGEDNRVQVARDLWEKCIVVTDVPLTVLE